MRKIQLKLRMFIVGSILFGLYMGIVAFALSRGISLTLVSIGLVGFIALQYIIGVKLPIKMMGGRELDGSHWLHDFVDRMADEKDMAKPTLYVGEMGMPNAFAVGRRGNGNILVSKSLLNTLNEEEIEGVVAHEMAHIDNRDSIIMLLGQSIASIVGYAVFFALAFADEDAGSFIGGWVGSIIAQTLVMLLVLAISRYREYVADRDAAEYIGDGTPLANALRKISSYSGKSSNIDDNVSALCIHGSSDSILRKLFASHPPTDKRINKLESY